MVVRELSSLFLPTGEDSSLLLKRPTLTKRRGRELRVMTPRVRITLWTSSAVFSSVKLPHSSFYWPPSPVVETKSTLRTRQAVLGGRKKSRVLDSNLSSSLWTLCKLPTDPNLLTNTRTYTICFPGQINDTVDLEHFVKSKCSINAYMTSKTKTPPNFKISSVYIPLTVLSLLGLFAHCKSLLLTLKF